MSAGLSITVDVDGEAGLPGAGAAYADRLSSRSERSYGITRGLPRILALLDERSAQATFYVPGVTAERHPGAIAALHRAGHEIAHHGHTHARPDRLAPEDQRLELERGIAALEAVTGRRPTGYRAPGWELAPATLALLPELGFAYDSSLMGDDRPYVLDAGGSRLLELPVHWSLDDAPFFRAGDGAPALARVWLRELELACAEHRHLTLTLHPEILGRPYRADVLRSVLEAAGQAGVPVVTHGTLAGSLHIG